MRLVICPLCGVLHEDNLWHPPFAREYTRAEEFHRMLRFNPYRTFSWGWDDPGWLGMLAIAERCLAGGHEWHDEDTPLYQYVDRGLAYLSSDVLDDCESCQKEHPEAFV